MNRSTSILVALLAGLAAGLALGQAGGRVADLSLAFFTPIGTLFVNLIRMTAVPLATAMIVSSLGAMPSADGLGRVSSRVVLTGLALLTAGAVASLLATLPLVARIPVDAAAATLGPARATALSATVPASGVESITTWLVDLVPTNVVKAAADGAMLPLIVFAVFFGLALTRIAPTRREAIVKVTEGVADAMQQVIAWVLVAAPVGVFALALPLAARLGVNAAGAIVAYIAIVVALTVAAVLVILYPAGLLVAGMRLPVLLSYCGPSQAVAFAGRSSLAALPVVIDSAEHVGLSTTTTRVILPIATTVFHFGTVIAHTVGALFLARLFGATLGVPQLASIVVTTVIASFAVPGVPGGSVIAMVPVLAAAGLPLEGIGVLLAVDAVPDMFRTAANVTGALIVSAMTDRRERTSH